MSPTKIYHSRRTRRLELQLLVGWRLTFPENLHSKRLHFKVLNFVNIRTIH